MCHLTPSALYKFQDICWKWHHQTSSCDSVVCHQPPQGLPSADFILHHIFKIAFTPKISQEKTDVLNDMQKRKNDF